MTNSLCNSISWYKGGKCKDTLSWYIYINRIGGDLMISMALRFEYFNSFASTLFFVSDI